MRREPLYITKFQARLLDSAMKRQYTVNKAKREYRKHRAACDALYRFIFVDVCCAGVYWLLSWNWTVNHMLILLCLLYIVSTVEATLAMQYIKLMKRLIVARYIEGRRILVKE